MKETAEDAAHAEAVRADLAAALEARGVKLPSLGVDVPPWPWGGPVLVELGGCNMATARALARALREGPAGTVPDGVSR